MTPFADDPRDLSPRTMANSVPTTEEDEQWMKEGGNLNKRTLQDRARDYKYFENYLNTQTEDTIEDLLKDETKTKEFQEHLLHFFFGLRVGDENNMRPKIGYAEKIKRSIKGQILSNFAINIYELPKFAVFATGWSGFCKALLKDGRADVEHKNEIPARVMEKIQKLLYNTVQAIKGRGTDEYEELLQKIPLHLHSQLNKLLQYGAQYELTRFNVRRGRENICEFKKKDIERQLDEIYNFHYYRVIKAEGDKNHKKTPTNVAHGGVIPFLKMDEQGYNPGELMELYLKFVPDMATMEGKTDGKLFVRPKVPSRKLDLNMPDNYDWYCENIPGKLRTISHLIYSNDP